jgi:CelD/BcsL family acetyltransferase involved in cellulose biosynthesis
MPVLASRLTEDRRAASGRNHDQVSGFYLLENGAISDLSIELLHRGTGAWLTPFQEHGWRDRWQSCVGKPDSVVPATVVITSGGRVVGALPLAIRQAHGLRILTWHAEAQSDYGAPIIDVAHLDGFCASNFDGILKAVCRQIGGIDLIYLTKQPATIAGSPNPLHLGTHYPYHVGTHAINFLPGEPWETFLTRTRSSSTLRQLRKKKRTLESLGAVAFRFATSVEDARSIAEHCLAAKSRQLALLGHHDPFASPSVRRFIVEYFAQGVGNSTWAAALTLDGELLATSIGLTGREGWLLYQMAMDCDHLSHCSPGSHLFCGIMEHCVKHGVLRLDLALGDERYKLEWCDEHQSLHTSVLPLTFKGRVAAVVLRLIAFAKRYIAASPRLYEHGKSLKKRLRSLHIPV